MSNVWAIGKANDYTMVAFSYRGGATDPHTDHCQDHCRAYWFNVAVQMANRIEGVVIDKGLYVAGNIGVYDIGEADRVLHLGVTNSHFNVATSAILAFTGGSQAIIIGNLIYEWQNNTGDWNGISLADYVDVQISDNQITTWPLTRTKVGITLGNVTRGIVRDNILRATTDPLTKGIICTGSNISSSGNQFSNCTVESDVSGTTAYSCSRKAWGTATAAVAANGTVVVNVPHGIGKAPTSHRQLVSTEISSGTFVPAQFYIGASDATVTQVAVVISGFSVAGNVRVNLYTEEV